MIEDIRLKIYHMN